MSKTTKPIPYIIQGNNVTLMVDNQSHTISQASHINYDRIVRALRKGKWNKVAKLVDIVKAVTNYANGKLEIKDGILFWDGREFHNAMSKRVLEMYKEGFDVGPMTAFMDNLMKNPSFRAVDELYGFLEKNALPITPDGCFMAYKRVKFSTANGQEGKFVDCHTGTFDNSVGQVVTMARNEVNDDAKQTCSSGLHFASLEYLSESGFGGNSNPIVLLKINPADVVSIPNDYNDQKGRCCSYEVVGVHGNDAGVEAFDKSVHDYTVDLSLRKRDSSGRYC